VNRESRGGQRNSPTLLTDEDSLSFDFLVEVDAAGYGEANPLAMFVFID
jgi:hypothetical protein